MSKLLTVFGATGQQGGSLISYILQHPQLSKTYRLRGITRDPSKSSAISLQNHGVEVIQADLNDPLSLLPAVADSNTVFAVTNCEFLSIPPRICMLTFLFSLGTSLTTGRDCSGYRHRGSLRSSRC